MEIKKPVIALLVGIVVFSAASIADAATLTNTHFDDSILELTCVGFTPLTDEAKSANETIDKQDPCLNGASNSLIEVGKKAGKDSSGSNEEKRVDEISSMTGKLI